MHFDLSVKQEDPIVIGEKLIFEQYTIPDQNKNNKEPLELKPSTRLTPVSHKEQTNNRELQTFYSRPKQDIVSHPSLSPRECEIARLVCKGLPNKTIGSVLDISQWTVATHLKRIYTKLGVRSRAAMVACIFHEKET